jgi:hypothetical protein
MRWYNEGKHETEGVFVLVSQRMVSNFIALIVIYTLAGQFS